MIKQTILHQCQRIKEATFSLPRAALHFPVGLFVAWLSYVNVPVCVLLGTGFIIYELAEDWRIKDRGFLDIIGYLFGLGAYVLFREIIF